MRLVTFNDGQGARVGLLREESVVDLAKLAEAQGVSLPGSMLELIEMGQSGLDLVADLSGDEAITASGAVLDLSAVTLLAPIPRPTKNIICVGVNYAAHAQESDQARGRINVTASQYPTLFSKVPTTINAPDGEVVVDPAITEQVDWEVELGVIIGRGGKNISRDDALGHVFGYTVINDVSARDIQTRHGGQFFKGKSIDGYCPMGPCIVTADEIPDPQNLRLQLRVNGETKQDGSTSDMIYDVAAIIESYSIGTTLEPGDIIATGTPSGVGFARNPPEFVKPGDIMEAEVEAIGVLRSPVVGV